MQGFCLDVNPPIGYDFKDRALIVNAAEAKTVRCLFQLYLDLGSALKVRDVATQRKLRSKVRPRPNGQIVGGKPFTRGSLYHLLSNPIYVGRIRHKGKTYPGRHKAIIDEKTWDAVQKRLADHAPPRQRSTNTKSPSLLTGLAFDETGDRLSPVHSARHGRRYRYYVSGRLTKGESDGSEGWRVRAEVLDNLVTSIVGNFLKNPRKLSEEIGGAVGSRTGTASEIGDLIQRVDLKPDSIAVQINRAALRQFLGSAESSKSENKDEPIVLRVEIALRRRGIETKLVLRDGTAINQKSDPLLCQTIASARAWFEEIASGRVTSIRGLSRKIGTDETDITRALPLAFLAPDIVEAILDGRQPATLTAEELRRIPRFPRDWNAQRRLLGLSR